MTAFITPRIKAESLPQLPVFEFSPRPLLHVIPSLFPAFLVSLHSLYQNEAEMPKTVS